MRPHPTIDSPRVTLTDLFSTTLLHFHFAMTSVINNTMIDVVRHQNIRSIRLIMARRTITDPQSTAKNIMATMCLVMNTIRTLKKTFALLLLGAIGRNFVILVYPLSLLPQVS